MAKRRHKKTKQKISPPQKTPQLHRFAIVTLLILIVISLGLRYKGFYQNHNLTFDEELHAFLGLQLKENPLNYDPEPVKRHFEDLSPGRYMPPYMNEPLFKHPPLFSWLLAISYFFKLKPFPYMSAIMVPMLLGISTIVFVYFFGKILYDYRVGLLAALFLTIDPIHWLCSEKIWMETTVTLFMFLALFFFFRGFNHTHFLLFSGLFAGFALFTRYSGILVPIFIFLFALIYKEELLFKRDFWLIFIITLAVFSPWLVWNYHSYGATFFKKMLDVQDIAHRDLQKYKISIILTSITIAFLLILRLLSPKLAPSIREKINSFFKGIRLLLAISILTAFILMLFYPSFRQGLKNMWIYNYLPSAGWNISMFIKEPWNFYFSRLLELSPIYLFSYLAAIFFSFKDTQKDSLLIISAFLIMAFFVLWGNYQSRYILPAVPILLILASRFLIWFWDRLRAQPQTLKIKISKAALIGTVGYFILKTINVGIHLALPNNVAYF